MVLGIVERGEAVPVGLDLGPIGDLEAERAPDRLDPLPGADHRMDAAAGPSARGQRDVERLFRKARVQLLAGELFAPRLERVLDRLLRGVELRALRPALLGRATGTKCGELAPLAQEARLRVLQRRDVARRAERGERARDDAFEVQP